MIYTWSLWFLFPKTSIFLLLDVLDWYLQSEYVPGTRHYVVHASSKLGRQDIVEKEIIYS
jgi:hypothetical protein